MSMSKYQGFSDATDSCERRIVLIGKTGAGKSASGNTILGREAFKSEFSPSSLTAECQKDKGRVGDRKVAVIDTPGLFDTNFTKKVALEKIKMCISLASPGPHAFLVVIKLGRFTQEEKETVRMIQTTFGEDASRFTMVLFTNGDQLKKQTIESYIAKSADLQAIIQSCSGRYHVFNNENEDLEQTIKLLDTIDKMTMANNGSHYTNDMFMRAEEAIVKEKKRLLRETEAQKQKELEELRAKYPSKVHYKEERKVTSETEVEKWTKFEERRAKYPSKVHYKEERKVTLTPTVYATEEREVHIRYDQEARARAERSNEFTASRVITLATAWGATAGGALGSGGGPIGTAAGAVAGAAVGATFGVAAVVISAVSERCHTQ